MSHVHTAIFKIDNHKELLYSSWNSVQCYVAAWIGGEFEGEWIHGYVWRSPFSVNLKLPQHCSLAIPQYKIKSSKNSVPSYISITVTVSSPDLPSSPGQRSKPLTQSWESEAHVLSDSCSPRHCGGVWITCGHAYHDEQVGLVGGDKTGCMQQWENNVSWR